MQKDIGYVGRSGLARILGVSETSTRNFETRQEIRPKAIVDGRPLYAVADAVALKAKRDAARETREAV
jgi:hypothetical protein